MLLQASGLCLCFHLTLTSVVFEYEKQDALNLLSSDLTLTSVVFESSSIALLSATRFYLTLTSVVFELQQLKS